MDSEDWFAAMEDDKESNKEEDEKVSNKGDDFKTPEASPRREEIGTPVDPFSLTPPFAAEYSTPKSTPGTPGKLTVVTKKDTP